MISRNNYGEITGLRDSEHETEVNRLIKSCVRRGALPKSYDTICFDRKGRAEGDAIHHEIYDVRPTPFAILLCVRKTEGSRYGVRTVSKSYYTLKRHGKGATCKPASKAIAAKAAKQAGDALGIAIDVLEGKASLKSLRPCQDGIAYKKVAVTPEGLASVYDDSPWTIGVERFDKALRDHNGGLYVYPSAAQAEKAPFPDSSVNSDAEKVIVKCLVSGTYCRYGEKLAFSRATPVEIV